MTQFVATNIKLTSLQNGADVLSDDDIYMNVNGFKFGFGYGNSLQQAPGFTNNTRPGAKEMRTGDTATLYPLTGTTTIGDGAFLPNGEFIQTIPFSNSMSFDVYDADGIFEGGDDFIGTTSYVAKGSEPLLGQGNFHFINFMNGSGSKYRLEYDINKLSSPTNGKIASQEGGLLNGSNLDGTLVGLAGKDIIDGNGGDDILIGGDNDDMLQGGKGDDLLFGGMGQDTLAGNKGHDTFVLARDFGFDSFLDFHVGEDKIGLANDLKFEDLSFVQQGTGTLVNAGSNSLAVLQGVQPNQLSASDFSQFDLANLNSRVQSDVDALSLKV